MKNKPKFQPVLNRVKLNVEQAVLSCTCFFAGRKVSKHSTMFADNVCHSGPTGDKLTVYNPKVAYVSSSSSS